MSNQSTKIKRTDSTKYWQGHETTQSSYTAGGSLISTYPLKSTWDYLLKLKLFLFYDHVISLLDVDLGEIHAHVYKDIYTKIHKQSRS